MAGRDDLVLIAGTGALASLFAARLAAQGVEVILLGTWQAALQALERQGVRLVSASGEEQAYRVRVTSEPEKVRGVRWALVLVKAWQTERAARHLAVCLAGDGLALTLQNGLGNDVVLSHALGADRVAVGVTTAGAALLEAGRVRAGGEGTVWLQAHPRLGPLEAVLRGAGFCVERVEDAQSLIWGKLVINSAINPLTALLDIPNGELLRRPAARVVMGQLATETAAVATAQGIPLPFDDPVQAAEQVALQTATNISSMLQDVRRGAPTEIDAICGAVVQRGEQYGVPTPVNRVCWHLVRARAAGGVSW